MRRGFSAIELVTALTMLAVVLALIGRAAVMHERVQRTLAAAHADARAAQQAAAILSAALAGAAPQDLAAGQLSDSAVDLDLLVGTGVACVMPSELAIGAAARDGAALSSQFSAPQSGDVALVLDESAAPPRWRALPIASVTAGPAACPAVPGSAGHRLLLAVPPGIGPLVMVRIVRRVRFSLYRSGDRLWYLGMRDWNAASNRFDAVQPVAGPLAAYSTDRARSGLFLSYLDSAGVERAPPPQAVDSVRTIRVLTRSESGAGAVARAVGLRRAP